MSEQTKKLTDEKKEDNSTVSGVITSDRSFRNKIYIIRGQKVMLDYDLAEIYGYTTSAFNQQVARNVKKFEGEDFMFQLNKYDLENISTLENTISISQNVISMQTKGVKGGRAKMPYAFTEQGIYMLMTVLRGELAVKQSRALIRMFKNMKDYIIESQELSAQREQLKIATIILENNEHIVKVENELINVDKRLGTIEDKANRLLKNSDISPVLSDFNRISEQREYVFLDGEPMQASELYADIYNKAKKNIYIIDNYVNIKTLRHLQYAKSGVEIIIFTDNLGKNLHQDDYLDFRTERSDLKIKFIQAEGKIHDRFIILDYGTGGEIIYHCGASEKDAGKRMTMISKCNSKLTQRIIEEVVERLMKNKKLILRQ